MDVMIDIESLGTSPDCTILSIGVVLFDPKGIGITSKLELKPSVEEQTEIYKRSIDEGTLLWWSKQSPEALNEALSDEGRIPFKECMEKVYKFCWNHRAVWSNGAGFDVVVMESAFRNLEMQIPWPYHSVRDTRTLFDICNVKLSDKKYQTKTTHKAVEDAEHQAIVVQDAYKKLIKSGLL
jgi:hypothetical protein